MRIICPRFFTVYGPRQRPDLAIHKFCRAIAAGKPIPMFGDGSTRRDYTDASDIIRGVRRALDWTAAAGPGFEVVNLGGARATSLIDLVRHLERLLALPAVLDWQEPQPGDVSLTYADTSHARELLGYEPQVPIEEGLARFVQWFMGGEWG
jgi:UDP-glucuronate 4-epimerase